MWTAEPAAPDAGEPDAGEPDAGPAATPGAGSGRTPSSRGRRLALLRLAGLAVAVAAAFVLVATTGSLSASGVRDWVDGAGVAAPLVFVLVSAGLTVACFPGPLLAGASGLLFGTAAGFPLSLCAAVLGASAAFSIGRAAGGDAVDEVGGARVERVRQAIGRHGFLAVLYARLAPGVPYSLVNYAAGLTPVRLGVFAAATALGAAPRAFAYTALGGSLGDLGSPEAIAAVVVLVVMALAGLLLARREFRPPGSGAGSSSPASPTGGPP